MVETESTRLVFSLCITVDAFSLITLVFVVHKCVVDMASL